MNVLLDISWSTLAVEGAEGKRGFTRVVDHYLSGLLGRSDIQLTTLSLSHDLYAHQFLKQSKIASATHYTLSRSQKQYGPAFTWLNTNIPKLNPVVRKPLRALRRTLIETQNRTKRFSAPIDTNVIQWADILHVPFNPLPLIQKTAGKPVVFVTLFDLIPLLFPNLVPQSFQTTFQAYLNSIDQDTHILSISASAKQDLLRVRPDIKPTNIHVTPLAASEVFKPCDDPQKILLAKEKYGIPANSQYILSVSRNDPNKNLSTLIQAFHMAYQRIKDPNLMLVLAGSHGKSTFEVVNEASRLASQTPGVIRTGYIHEDDLPAIYSGALFFAFPSLYEGFGLPVLEAMQCGTPVISSNTSSLPEVTGGAGKLIEPLNIDAWVAAICELYEDKTLRMKMSLLSHEQAGLFSWQNTLDLTVAAYKEALHLQM